MPQSGSSPQHSHLRSTASGSTSTRKVGLSWGNACWPPSGRVTRRPGLCWSGACGGGGGLVGDVPERGWRIAGGGEGAGAEAGAWGGAVVGPLVVDGAGGGGDLDDLLGWVVVEGGEQVALRFGEFGALPECAAGSGEGDDVEPVEVGADGDPGVSGGGLRDAHEQQREPAEQDVGADTVFESVVDRAQVEHGFQVPPAAFDFQELL